MTSRTASAYGSMRLALIAPSGSGKSTVAAMLRDVFERRGLSTAVLKLAAPLYRLQRSVYLECGVELQEGSQNRGLMEMLAGQMRAISPDALVAPFLRELQSLEADVVINDDLRDHKVDWPALVAQRFQIVLVKADPELLRQRLTSRGDLGRIFESEVDRHLDHIRPDHTLTNAGSLDDLRSAVESLATRLLND